VLGNITLRAKMLIAVALGCAGYIVMSPDASQTIEPVRTTGSGDDAGRVDRAGHEAAAGRKSLMQSASFSFADRIVKDTAAASLFSAQSWYVAPPAPPPAPVVVQAPPAPTAPPLPFAYMGSYRPEGAQPTYFLTAGDRVYDVKVGDTLDSTYTVDAVRSGQLLLTYIPLKIQQSLAVGNE
jgi:hypothetical protein